MVQGGWGWVSVGQPGAVRYQLSSRLETKRNQMPKVQWFIHKADIDQRYRRKVLYKSHYLWVASLNVYFHCSCRQQDDTTEQEVSSVSRVGLCCAFPAVCWQKWMLAAFPFTPSDAIKLPNQKAPLLCAGPQPLAEGLGRVYKGIENNKQTNKQPGLEIPGHVGNTSRKTEWIIINWTIWSGQLRQ